MLRLSVCCGLLLISWHPRVRAQLAAPATAFVEGDVIDADTRAPVAGARIRLAAGEAEPIFSRTGSDGHFVFENLPPEVYSLNAEKPGFLPLGFVPHNEKQRTSTTIDLRISRPRSDPNARRNYSPPAYGPTPQVTRSLGPDGAWHVKVKIRLMAYAVITGRVTDPDGRLLEGALVDLSSTPAAKPGNQVSAIPVMSQTQTNGKGEFCFAYLRPGEYSIRLSGFMHPEPKRYRLAYYRASAKLVEVGPGQRVRADIQILVPNPVRLSGRLMIPPGVSPPSRASLQTNILLTPERDHNSIWRAAGKDVYEVKDLVPGKYFLTAVTSVGPETQSDANFKPVFGLARAIEIGDRDMDHFDLTLQPIRDVAGRVTFREGCAHEALRVVPIPMSGILTRWNIKETAVTDDRFVLHDLGVGLFTLAVHPPSEPGLLETSRNVVIRLGSRDVTQSGFEAPANAAVDRWSSSPYSR